MEISPRLPVHYPNRSDENKYNYYKPSNSYPGPSHIYVPPNMANHGSSINKPSNKPTNTYIPPFNSTPRPIQNPLVTYLPPIQTQRPTNKPNVPNNTYLPPNNPSQSIISTSPRPQGILNGNNQITQNILTELVPPKEEVVCPIQSECCDDSSGKLVIPIPLKNRNSNDDCCIRTAKLVVPLSYFDTKAVEKLKEAFTKEEFDADNLIRTILESSL